MDGRAASTAVPQGTATGHDSTNRANDCAETTRVGISPTTETAGTMAFEPEPLLPQDRAAECSAESSTATRAPDWRAATRESWPMGEIDQQPGDTVCDPQGIHTRLSDTTGADNAPSAAPLHGGGGESNEIGNATMHPARRNCGDSFTGSEHRTIPDTGGDRHVFLSPVFGAQAGNVHVGTQGQTGIGLVRIEQVLGGQIIQNGNDENDQANAQEARLADQCGSQRRVLPDSDQSGISPLLCLPVRGQDIPIPSYAIGSVHRTAPFHQIDETHLGPVQSDGTQMLSVPGRFHLHGTDGARRSSTSKAGLEDIPCFGDCNIAQEVGIQTNTGAKTSRDADQHQRLGDPGPQGEDASDLPAGEKLCKEGQAAANVFSSLPG